MKFLGTIQEMKCKQGSSICPAEVHGLMKTHMKNHSREARQQRAEVYLKSKYFSASDGEFTSVGAQNWDELTWSRSAGTWEEPQADKPGTGAEGSERETRQANTDRLQRPGPPNWARAGSAPRTVELPSLSSQGKVPGISVAPNQKGWIRKIELKFTQEARTHLLKDFKNWHLRWGNLNFFYMLPFPYQKYIISSVWEFWTNSLEFKNSLDRIRSK